MFAPHYMEQTLSCKIVRRGSGESLRFVPDIPEEIRIGLCLVYCMDRNFYAYPLPPETEGRDCIAHIVYFSEDDSIVQKFAGKIGAGNEVCKTTAYKSLVTTTVADVKVAEMKAEAVAEAAKLGQVVSQATLDAVKYDIKDHPEALDGNPLWVFQEKEYIDK